MFRFNGQVQAELAHISLFKMSIDASISLALITTLNMEFFMIVYFVFIATDIRVNLVVVDCLVPVFLICRS
jgi:hypothetical protein